MFSIRKVNELIINNDHFWCRGHLDAVSINQRSSDFEYCHQCYAVIKEASKVDTEKDSWVKGDYVFIHHSKGYTVAPDGSQCCIGLVDVKGNVLEDISSISEALPSAVEDVAKLSANDILLPDDISGSFATSNIEEKPKHPGGRPRKTDDDVHRVTKWRHKKELQGVLL